MIDERPDGHTAQHRRRGEGFRAVLKLSLVAVLAVVFAGGVYVVKGRFDIPDFEGAGRGDVQVTIAEQSTLTAIGDALFKAGVVRSTRAFVAAAEDEPRAQTIQSGTFRLRKEMSGAAAVLLLLDKKSRVIDGIPIPEGTTTFKAYEILSKATGVPYDDFSEAGKDPVARGVPKSWFAGQKGALSIEGFLFPDTYEFKNTMTAEQMLEEMVRHFLTVAKKIDFSDRVRAERGISPYEALTVASLAQAEAGNNDDLGKIARVAYNRVYSGDFPCDCLEFDVGINYYYQLTGRPTKPSKDMTKAELTDPKNPYRTDGKPGLTPTPINNPGQAALQGAMSPPAGPWLYFVAIDKQGHSAFAATYAEQQKNEATARKNGVL